MPRTAERRRVPRGAGLPRDGHELRGPATRAARGQAAAGGGAAGDADRPGRRRQDAARDRGRALGAPGVPGRRVDGRPRQPRRPGAASRRPCPSALGVRDAAGPRGRAAARRPRCATATALLVLDNCEHLLDACAAAGRRRCCAPRPGLRVLATSREPLGDRRRARAVACPPLASPDPDAVPPVEALSRLRGGRAAWSSARAACAPDFALDGEPTRRPSPGCARGSTASRWPSSWPRRACVRCRSPQSSPGSTTASRCSPAAAARRCRASRRCAR